MKKYVLIFAAMTVGILCGYAQTVYIGSNNVFTAFPASEAGDMFFSENPYINYTGNTDYLSSDAKSSPKGIKADTEVVISGGKINVSCSGYGGEGIESKGLLTIEGGEIYATTYDDCINSSSHMYIKGGEITAISTGNDGIDSNGNLYIEGGYIMAFGISAPECGIDANEEEGYSVIFTGGILLAVGGGNSVPDTDASTQPYVTGSNNVSGGNDITLMEGDTVLASFTVPAAYNNASSG